LWGILIWIGGPDKAGLRLDKNVLGGQYETRLRGHIKLGLRGQYGTWVRGPDKTGLGGPIRN